MTKATCYLILLITIFHPVALADGHSQDKASLTVGLRNDSCPNAKYSSIQNAIETATPGSDIFVCAGIYDEQPVITKSLRVRLDRNAVIRPSSMQQNGFSLSSGNPFAAIILVTNSMDVQIEGGQMDGSASGITGCSPRLFGVVYHNSSGSVRDAKMRRVKLGPNLDGCQSGTAVLIQAGNGGTARVTVERLNIADYQKNGITADGSGAYAKIYANRIVGSGPTDGAAQNGIQISFGAGGEISRKNVVINNEWSGCISFSNCEFFATGILIEQSNNVRVFDNIVGNSQVNLVFEGDRNSAFRNSLFNAQVLDDVQIQGVDCEIAHNLITKADHSGVFVSGDKARVEHNTFVEMPIGILKLAGVQQLEHDENNFFHVDQDFVDPPPAGAARPQPEQP